MSSPLSATVGFVSLVYSCTLANMYNDVLKGGIVWGLSRELITEKSKANEE